MKLSDPFQVFQYNEVKTPLKSVIVFIISYAVIGVLVFCVSALLFITYKLLKLW